jgi:Holliday junction resolvase
MTVSTKKDDETDGSSSPPEERKRLGLKWLENPNYERARRSNKQERKIATKLGGIRRPQSGGKRWSKYDSTTEDGDMTTPEFQVEHKRTDKKSISIKREYLDKVKIGARKFGKDPAVAITFQDPQKPYAEDEDWIMVPLEVARRILGYTDDD